MLFSLFFCLSMLTGVSSVSPVSPVSPVAIDDSSQFQLEECRIDLHNHFEANVFPCTIIKVAYKKNVTLPDDIWDYQRNFCYPTFDEFGKTYYALTSPLKTSQDYYTWAKAQLQRFKTEEGICYTEIIICPDCVSQGVSWKDMYAEIKQAVDEEEEENVFYPRLILTFIRGKTTEAEALAYVEWIAELHRSGDKTIVGIDVSGNEKKLPDLNDFVKAYKAAADLGIGRTVHAGELIGAEAIEYAITSLGVQRIGHGIAAMHSNETRAMIKNNNVTLEICPTSNKALHAQNITTYMKHPFPLFWSEEINMVIGPDDPSLFGTTMSREESILMNYFGLTKDEIHWIYYNSIAATFAPDDLKEKLYVMIEQAYGKISPRRSRLRN